MLFQYVKHIIHIENPIDCMDYCISLEYPYHEISDRLCYHIFINRQYVQGMVSNYIHKNMGSNYSFMS